MSAMALSGDEVQVRSFPCSHGAHVRQAGFEHVRGLGMAEAGARVAEEAIALLTAPACEPGRSTIILDGHQLALQVHESVGHAVELDRVLGTEASYAGTSFVTVGDVGSLMYGSELMNVTADATVVRRPRQLRLGRRGRAGAHRADRAPRGARRVPVLA